MPILFHRESSNMVAAPSQPSLLDDWRQRRQRLADAPVTDLHARFQIKLLDYLIRRYDNSPAANMPARFPLRIEPTLIARAIVIHQELSRRRPGNVRSA